MKLPPAARWPCSPRVLWGHLLLLGTVLLMTTPALAEVSVVTDARGKYVRTLFLIEMQGSQRLIWNQVRAAVAPSDLLNVNGDRMGDSVPFVMNQPDRRQPWVVWAAGDGHDKEIAFATWAEGRWYGPSLVERTDNPYDDLGPRLAFDATGRAVLVWWRKEPIPKVYLSVQTSGTWSAPVLVSDPATPSWIPSIRTDGNRVVISFYTPFGQTVLFQTLAAPAILPEGSGPLDGPVPPPGVHPSPPGDPPPSRPTGVPGPPPSPPGVQKPTIN